MPITVIWPQVFDASTYLPLHIKMALLLMSAVVLLKTDGSGV